MNKITSKYCCLFAINELRIIYEHKPMSNKKLTVYINNAKRKWKSYYNSVKKHKLGKRKKIWTHKKIK